MKFLDLFAGAGGLSEGFVREGFEPVAHVELWEAACYTLKTREAFHYLENNGQDEVYAQYLRGEITRDELYAHIPKERLDSVICKEISDNTLQAIFKKIDELKGNDDIDLIVGGPPCLSNIGQTLLHDVYREQNISKSINIKMINIVQSDSHCVIKN